MVIGVLGEVVFETSSFKVNTFDDYKRDTKAKYAEHELIGLPGKLEYLHRDLEEISFTMTLHRELGTDPTEETQKLRDSCKEGIADYLIIANHAVGENPWVIESLSEDVLYFDGEGKVLANKLNIRLKEYVE